MHYMDANKTDGEEARRQLHKNAASNLEQDPAAIPHKTPTIRPPASYHENYPSWTNQTCRTLLEKQGRTPMYVQVMYSYGPQHMAGQKQDDQNEHTFRSYVRIWDVALKTCQRRWTIEKSGGRGSGISVLGARHDDDDDVDLHWE